MRKIFALIFLFPVALLGQGQANMAGVLFASNFTGWSVAQGNNGNYNWTNSSFCRVSEGGLTFNAFTVGVPIYLADTSNPSTSETVTPTAVTINNSGCSIRIAPVNQHQSFYFKTATAGLGEAIGYANNQSFIVELTPQWQQLGGLTSMITASIGNYNVSILDLRTSVAQPYTWNGTQYVANGATACAGGCVTSIGVQGSPLTNNVVLAPGSNVGINQVGQTITISSTGGGGSGSTNPGVQRCDLFPGADWVDQCNKAAIALGGNGGTVDATAYVGAVYSTTKMTATAQPNTVLKLNPGTSYWFNQQFTTDQINASAATQTSGASGACIVPIGNQSAIISEGYNSLGGVTSLRLGPSAATYDFVCNAAQGYNTQESFRMDGVAMEGNPYATMKGSILHIVGTYGPGSVDHSSIYYPYGAGLTVTQGSTINFSSDMFDDSYPYAGGPSGIVYPGSLITIACSTNLNFISSQIGNNGLHNPQLVVENCTVNTDGSPGVPTTGQGYPSGQIRFIGNYWEPEPATLGTFPGAPTNVDPIQLYDPINFEILGGVGAGGNAGQAGTDQHNMIDIYSNSSGQPKGPVDIDAFGFNNLFNQSGRCFVNNANNTSYVAPQLRCVKSQQNGDVYYATYHWAGSGATAGSIMDMRDYANFSSVVANKLQVPALTFSQLAACSSTTAGSIASISDSGSNVWGVPASGMGPYPATVACDGNQWNVIGAYNATTLQTSQADVLGGIGNFATGSGTYGTGFVQSGCNEDGGLNVCTYTRTNSTAPPGLTYSQQIQMTTNTDPSRGFNGIITTSTYSYSASSSTYPISYRVSMWAKSDGTFVGQPFFDWTDYEGNTACSQISGQYLTTSWTLYSFTCSPTTSGTLPIGFGAVPALNSTGTFWIGGVSVAPSGPLTVGDLVTAIGPYSIGPATSAQQTITINTIPCVLGGSCTVSGGGGSGTVSGQASGVIPLATGSTAIGAQSHLNENTSGVDTFTQPVVVTGPATGIYGLGTATFSAGNPAQVGSGGMYAAPACYTNVVCDSFGGEATFTTGAGTLSAGTIFTVNFPGTRTNVPSCTVNISGGTGTWPKGFMQASNTGGTVVGPITTDIALAQNTQYSVAWGPCSGQ